jgi:hypothetical protein
MASGRFFSLTENCLRKYGKTMPGQLNWIDNLSPAEQELA